jgi:hypothetical protein
MKVISAFTVKKKGMTADDVKGIHPDFRQPMHDLFSVQIQEQKSHD